MTDHSIVPPPHLLKQWLKAARDAQHKGGAYAKTFAMQAIEWAAPQIADQELEACCHLLRLQGFDVVDDLRAARRPKPPSLKEQALTALSEADQGLNESEWQQRSDTIRRALSELPND